MKPRTLTGPALPLAVFCLGCLLLGSSSCGRSPTVPAGSIRVHVSQDAPGPASGKLIELVGMQQQRTDSEGLAVFVVEAGHYTVRAHDINTPGPPPAYIDKEAVVQPGMTTDVEYFDCTLCRAPRP